MVQALLADKMVNEDFQIYLGFCKLLCGNGEVAELAEGARLLSYVGVLKTA